MMPSRNCRLLLIAAFSTLSMQALADAIDGRWCAEDGRRLVIQWPSIVTPNGTSVSGDYDRHGFSCITATRARSRNTSAYAPAR